MLFSITVTTTLSIILTSIFQVIITAPLIRQPPATIQRVTTIATITTASGAIPTPHTIIIAPLIRQAPATM